MSDKNGTSAFSIAIAPIVIIGLILLISHYYHPTILDYIVSFGLVAIALGYGAYQIAKGGALDNAVPYVLLAIALAFFMIFVGLNIA